MSLGRPMSTLGILLAELAVGERPYPNTKVADGSTLQSWEEVEQLPQGLREFILHLTAADPVKRPTSARSVADTFIAECHDEAIG